MESNERFEIFENGELIGEDYQRENGEWSHRWIDGNTNEFERGSWPGRAQGDKMKSWVYELTT